MTMIPPRVAIPRSDNTRERYGPVAVSLVFHLLILMLLLWKGMPVESELLIGDLGGGGGGGNNGEQTSLISLASPPEAPPVPIPTPPVTPDPIPVPTPDPVPQPPKDTVKTPPAPTPAPVPAPVATTGTTGSAGDAGAGSAGSGGGAGGGSGGGTGTGLGQGSGSGTGGGGGGGDAVDGIIPPSPMALNLPPAAPKSIHHVVVVIDLTVDPLGKVLDAQLKQSTGNSKYDNLLQKTALGWRFRPARNRLGEAVKATVPVTYTIN